MRKRILAVLLALCMALAALPMTAFAADLTGSGTEADPYQVATEEDLRAAVDAGGYIELTASFGDISSSGIAVDKAVTLDLNGQTLTFTKESSALFSVESTGSLTVEDSAAGGRLDSTKSRVVQVLNGGSFTLNGGTLEVTDGDMSADVTVLNIGTVTIDGGTVRGVTPVYNMAPNDTDNAVCNLKSGKIEGVPCTTASKDEYIGANWACTLIGAGVDGAGSVKNPDGVILNITGGEITAASGGQAIATNASSGKYAGFVINMTAGSVIASGDGGCAMYLPAIGVTNISGGTVSGTQGIRIAAGELNVTGGEIIGTALLTENADLISGGSGGTQGAIVVGKASSGYVGNASVAIGGTAVIKNTAEGEGTKPAIIVSDKNMGEGGSYDQNSIEVSLDGAEVQGDVVKVSNTTPGATTKDGGNTSLTVKDTTIEGNVINKSKEGSTELSGVTVTGDVKTESAGSTLISNSKVEGSVTNATAAGSTVITGSEIGSVNKDTGNIVITDSTVDGTPVEDDLGGNKVLVGGKPYASLDEALTAAKSGQTVTLLVSEIALESAIPAGVTLSVGSGQKLTVAEGDALTVLGSTGTLAVQAGGSFVLADDEIVGEDGRLAVDAGSVEIVLSTGAVTLKSGAKATVPSGKELNLLLPGGAVRLDVTIENGASATVSGKLTVPNDASLSVDGTLNISSSGLLRVGSKGTLSGSGEISNSGKVTLHRGVDTEAAVSLAITLNSGGEVYSQLTETDLDSLIERGEKTTGSFTVAGITGDGGELLSFATKYTFKTQGGGTIVTTYPIQVAAVANGTVSASTSAAMTGSTVTLTVKPADGFVVGSVTVTAADGSAVAVTAGANGTWTFTMPAGAVTVSASFQASETGLPYTDVQAADWFYSAVKYVTDNEIMNGCDTDLFLPNEPLSRGMLVTVLWRMENSVAVGDSLVFDDVDAGAWYGEAVRWAAANGIVNGVTETTFAPDSAITREQLAVILYRYAQHKGYDVTAGGALDYPDAQSVADYAAEAMQWACAESLINGMDGLLNPQGGATRAQVATIIMRLCENVAK